MALGDLARALMSLSSHLMYSCTQIICNTIKLTADCVRVYVSVYKKEENKMSGAKAHFVDVGLLSQSLNIKHYFLLEYNNLLSLARLLW